MVVRSGVVRAGRRCQTRVRVVTSSGRRQGVVVVRVCREVDAERRRTRSRRLRHAVWRRKVRWLEVGGGGVVSTDVARSSVSSRTTTAGRRRSRTAVLRAVQRPQLTG